MDSINAIIEDLAQHISILQEVGQHSAYIERQVVLDITKPAIRRSSIAASGIASGATAAAEKGEPLSATVLRNANRLQQPEERLSAMRKLHHEMNHCFDCELCKNRDSTTLPGEGNLNSPDIMVVGECADDNDKAANRIFSGEAGTLFAKMLASIGYRREDVYVTNVCKCPSPGNRKPSMRELRACHGFLEEQIRIVRPKVILIMGEHAGKALFYKEPSLLKPQGSWSRFHGIPVMTTFHPKYILRFSDTDDKHQTALKRAVWRALQSVERVLRSRL
jgi:uracil-DNA glycosylase